jgi:hypothetical protein
MRDGVELPERMPPPWKPPPVWKPPPAPPPPWKPPPPPWTLPPPPPWNPPPPPWKPPPDDPPPRCANAGIAAQANKITMLIVHFENVGWFISRPPQQQRKTCSRARRVEPLLAVYRYRFYIQAGGCIQAIPLPAMVQSPGTAFDKARLCFLFKGTNCSRRDVN